MKLEINNNDNVRIEYLDGTNISFLANAEFIQLLKDTCIDERKYINLNLGDKQLFINLNNIKFIFVKKEV